MKKIYSLHFILLSLSLCFCTTQRSAAQFLSLYTFSQSAGIYNTLTAPTVLASGTGLDNQRYNVSLPFNFIMDNVSYSSVYVGMNGYISFGNTNPGTDYWMISSTASGFRLVSGFDYDLGSLNASTELSYQVSGLPPNRVFTAQWENMGRPGFTSLDATFQIKLYETTNNIEISYGSISLDVGNTISVQVGLRGLDNTAFLNRSSSTSNWNATTSGAFNTSNIYYTGGSNPSSGQKYLFTAPPNCTAPNAPSNLVLTPSLTSVSGTFTASAPAAYKYLVVRTPNVPLNTTPVDGATYTVGASLGNGIVVSNSATTSFTSSGLNQTTFYTYTVFAYNDAICFGGSKYNTLSPLTGTAETMGPRKYTWLPIAGSADFQVASNWLPLRTFTNALDTLVFNQGGQVNVTNVPNQSISGLEIANNSHITMSSLVNDSLIIGNYLNVNYATSLTLDGSTLFGLSFKNVAGARQSNIDGVLTLAGNNRYNASNSITEVSGTVNVNHSSALFYDPCTTCFSDITVFLANSNLNLNRNAPVIPKATYDVTSTIHIIGITTSGPTNATGSAYPIGNLIIDCPLATINFTLPNNTIKGDFTIPHVGTGTMTVSGIGVQGITKLLNGKVTFGGVTFYDDVFLDTGYVRFNFTNIFKKNLTTTIQDTIQITNTNTLVEFSGFVHQYLHMGGQYVSGSTHTLKLDNANGATFTGSLTLNSGCTLKIDAGAWIGNGTFIFGNTASLQYNHTLSHQATTTEWPAISGPKNVTVNLGSGFPYNQLHLPGHRTIGNVLTLTKGVVVLDTCNLTFEIPPSVYLPDTNKMIATNGSGQVFIKYPIGTQSTLYPIGDISGILNYSPVKLSVSNNTVSRYIGAGVAGSAHPNSPANAMPRYWRFTDTAASNYTYSLELQTDSSEWISSTMFLHAWNGSAWNFNQGIAGMYKLYSIMALNTSTNPLHQRAFTGFPIASLAATNVYTWTGAINTDYQNAQNWNPIRTTPTFNDHLIFNNGGTDSIINIPSEIVRRVSISSLTNVIFTPADSNRIYTFKSDNNLTTDELFIDVASSLYLRGTNFNINFTGTQNTASINGRLELLNPGTVKGEQIDFTNCQAIVSQSAVLASGGTNTLRPFISTDSNLHIYGTYENKYKNNFGYFPYASWKDGSQANLIGAVSYTNPYNLADVGLDQSFYNFTYDCANQTGLVDWANKELDSVRNEFTLVNTGSSSWRSWGIKTKKFLQTGGKTSGNQELYVTDSLVQSGGLFYNAYGTSGIYFVGQNAQQVFICKDSAFSGFRENYYIQNPYGIQIIGTGYFATSPNFLIPADSYVYVQTPLQNPITTTLTMVYHPNLTGLAYQYPADLMSDTLLFPAINGPSALKVEIGTGHTLTLPFTRTLSKKLEMVNGDINIGSNNLTLGTSPTSFPQFNYTSGSIYMTTGYFTRWFTTSGVGTSGTDLTFPLSDGQQHNRRVYLSLPTLSMLSGGTISARHQSIPGNTTGFSIADGAYTITEKCNSKWDFIYGNGFNAGMNFTIRVGVEGLDVMNNTSNLRLTNSTPVTGTHVNGSGTYPLLFASRSGLTQTQMSDSSFQVGFNTNIPSNSVYSIASGNWNDPAIWNISAVPTQLHNVIVSTGDSVNITTNQSAHSILINAHARLQLMNDTIQIDSAVSNYGTFRLDGGHLRMGPVGGGKTVWRNYDSMYIHAGTMMINGQLYVDGKLYAQDGGDIIVDGNANGIVNQSMTGTFVVMVPDNVQANGGTITIVDPSVQYQEVFAGGGFDAGHTLILGDGVSTTSGSALAFKIEPYDDVGSLLIKGSPSGINRHVFTGQDFAVKGDFTLQDSNALFDLNVHSINIKGNVLLDTNTTFLTEGNVILSSSNPQELSGEGTIENQATNPNGNFRSLYIENTSPEGVHFFIGDFVCTYIHLETGKLTIGQGNTVAANPVIGSGYTGWLHGRFGISPSYFEKTIPVGDSLAPLYVTVKIDSATQFINSMGLLTYEVFTNDHPAIGSSSIDQLHSVNKYVRIDTSGGANFSAGYSSLTFNYRNPYVDYGSNPVNFEVAHYEGGMWNEESPSANSFESIQIYKDFNAIQGVYSIGESALMPFITLQPVNRSVCSNDSASFSVNALLNNLFQWEVNTGSGWASLALSSIYSGVNAPTLHLTNILAIMNGYQYRCKVSNQFGNVYSTAATLTVGTGVIPTIQINASSATTICANETVIFNAAITDGGTTPSYNWLINGVSQGINSPSISLSGLNNNDVISCQLTSSSNCALPPLVNSNSITMTVNPMLTPSISILANPGTSICNGTAVTFTATPVNGGSTPSYQWKKNGSNVGSNSPVYVDNAIANGNTISCVLTSTETCVPSPIATSNTYTMTVTNLVTPVVTIAANPGTTICAGTNVTFTATPVNGGGAPQYQWLKNGVPVGTNSNTYNDNGLVSSDQITCILTSNVQCVTTSLDTSNLLIMTVNPSLTPVAIISVSPSDTICSGTSVTFTSSVTNQGTSISYTWKKNGTITVSSSASYTTSGLLNGDVLTLIINTTPQCATTSIDTSNAITMTVTTNVTPTLTIAANPGTTICNGDSVTFTATPTFGGTTPVYQWKKNGLNVGTNSATYGDIGLINTDQIQCIMNSSQTCVSTSVANSNTITMTVNPMVTPTISISANPGTVICSGTTVTFTAIPSNGGAAPVYQWKVNGVNAGTNSNTFVSAALINGDVIQCELSSSNVCATPANVSSNTLSMIVNPTTTPSVSISANPGTIITTGQTVTFTAVALNAGSTPLYQWKLNGSNVGVNSNVYSNNTFVNADEVTCEVSSSDTCSQPAIVLSNVLKISIADALGDIDDLFSAIYCYPNPSNGSFTIKGQITQHNAPSLHYEVISLVGNPILSGDISIRQSVFEQPVQFHPSVASGHYLLKLSYEGKVAFYRMVLNR